MHATRRLLDYVYKKGSYYDVGSMDDCRVYVKSVTGGLRDRPRRPGDLPPLLSGDLRAGGLSRSLRGGERLGRLRGGLRGRFSSYMTDSLMYCLCFAPIARLPAL